MLAEMPSSNTVLLTVLAVATAYNAWQDRRDKRVAAVKVAEVKGILETNTAATRDQLSTIKNTGEDTHKLVNNAMAIQLTLTAISARALANNTKKRAHIKLAEDAETKLEEHMAQQASVDKAIEARK